MSETALFSSPCHHLSNHLNAINMVRTGNSSNIPTTQTSNHSANVRMIQLSSNLRSVCEYQSKDEKSWNKAGNQSNWENTKTLDLVCSKEEAKNDQNNYCYSKNPKSNHNFSSTTEETFDNILETQQLCPLDVSEIEFLSVSSGNSVTEESNLSDSEKSPQDVQQFPIDFSLFNFSVSSSSESTSKDFRRNSLQSLSSGRSSSASGLTPAQLLSEHDALTQPPNNMFFSEKQLSEPRLSPLLEGITSFPDMDSCGNASSPSVDDDSLANCYSNDFARNQPVHSDHFIPRKDLISSNINPAHHATLCCGKDANHIKDCNNLKHAEGMANRKANSYWDSIESKMEYHPVEYHSFLHLPSSWNKPDAARPLPSHDRFFTSLASKLPLLSQQRKLFQSRTVFDGKSRAARKLSNVRLPC